jgi:hypothetical protein
VYDFAVLSVRGVDPAQTSINFDLGAYLGADGALLPVEAALPGLGRDEHKYVRDMLAVAGVAAAGAAESGPGGGAGSCSSSDSDSNMTRAPKAKAAAPKATAAAPKATAAAKYCGGCGLARLHCGTCKRTHTALGMRTTGWVHH